MSKKIAIYVRVSTKQQDQRSQEGDLKRWLAGHEGEDVEWFRDHFTGKSMQRPGMERMMADIEAGRISSVVVWRLDRLGRTARGLTALFEDLRERGVNLVSLRDALDLSSASGRLMANVLASVAAFETEVRAERVLAGQAAARAAGKTWGGSVKGRRLKVTTEQIAVIEHMKKEGARIAAIARATGLSRPTIYAVLRARKKR